MITALAGGVGAARFLRGLVRAVPQQDVTVVINTADDIELHGLHISPDIDTVLYTLGERIDQARGWGVADESWRAMESLRILGGPAWFNLGDRDLGMHMYRTGRLRNGDLLSDITADQARAFGLGINAIPMTNERVETRVTVDTLGEIGFQEYFVGHQHSVPVSKVRFDGIEGANAAPGVVDALVQSALIVICPSNPIVSIGPLLALPEIAQTLRARRDAVVAISPIVDGKALKGPADRLMKELGHEASVVGVARLYAPFASTLIVDISDATLASEVEAAGMRCVVAPTVMGDVEASERLARAVLQASS